MKAMKSQMLVALVSLLLWGVSFLDAGIINTGGSAVNTTAPTGAYADSGWQYTGQWGSGGAVVVSPTQILTAKHFSATTFTLNGKSYTALSTLDMAGTDLRLVTLDTSTNGPFTSYASIYTGSTTGAEAVIVGNGYQNGIELSGQGWKPSTTKGLQWGTNTIDTSPAISFASNPDVIAWDFDSIAQGSTPQEYGLTDMDSGGGVFVNDGGTWKLTGVNYSVVTHFNPAGAGPDLWVSPTLSENSDGSDSFLSGGIYDATELYYDNGSGGWTLIPGSATAKSYSFATDLTATDNAVWLAANIDPTIPEPATMSLLALGGWHC